MQSNFCEYHHHKRTVFYRKCWKKGELYEKATLVQQYIVSLKKIGK